MSDEKDKTNPRTPSAQHALGLATCPKCDGKKVITFPFIGGEELAAVECDLCKGGGRVDLTTHHAYVGLKL